jgi:hypothetical protein
MIANRTINNEEKWSAVADEITAHGGDGKAVSEALKELYSVYTEDMLVWLGRLFDSRIGGFYYSLSAKDSDGYLPDIESTYQAIVLLRSAGLISEYRDIPEAIRKKIAGFICSLEDPDSGYFYHPQWSRELTDEKVSRKGRDLTWATFLSSGLGFDLPYPSAYARLDKGGLDTDTYENKILSSEEAFLSYLKEQDFEKDYTRAFHRVISLSDQITHAGLGSALIDYLDGIQRDNGFWRDEPNLDSACAFWGVAALYNSFSRPLKNADKVAEYIINELFCSGKISEIDGVWLLRNVWGALHTLTENISNFGAGTERAEELLDMIMKKAPTAILATAKRLAEFRKPTGAFSMNVNDSPTTSQGVPVAPENTVGGDMNATAIAVGMIRSIKCLLHINGVGLNLFEPEDLKKFTNEIKFI